MRFILTIGLVDLFLHIGEAGVPINPSATLAAAGGLLLAGEAGAIQAPAVDLPSAPATVCCLVPAHTLVAIEITDTINSKSNVTRDSFSFRLAEPLTIDGRLVARAGAPGVGEVVHAARARAAGKAGELILATRYLEIDGRRITLRSFRYGPSQGKDNSGAVGAANLASAALPLVSVLGFMVSGGNINVPAGTRATAQTAAEAVLSPLD